MAASRAILLLSTTALASWAQDNASPPPLAPSPPPCGSYSLNGSVHLTAKQKLCFYGEQRVLTGSAIFGAAFFSMVSPQVATMTNSPPEPGGFWRRFGTRYAQGLTKSTADTLVGILNREDPRSNPPPDPADDHSHRAQKPGFGPRLGSALLRTVWTHRDSGRDFLALSHFAGAFSSGFVGMAWTPDPQNTVGEAFKRSGTAFGGYIASSIFTEFQPDIFTLFGRVFFRAPKKPAADPARSQP